ncbi:MAG: DEAD/DEAH box helicase [Chloroflexi bacterium]|nr:DEAD/DEAH box helicase [Chloroflexota bacterium]
MRGALVFDGGTLILYDVDEAATVHRSFRWVKARWRCEAHHYRHVRQWLRELPSDSSIRDRVPRWDRLTLRLDDARSPHDYQTAALRAWETAERRGSIILPTGAGKTFVAIHAIQRAGCSSLIVAPTIDLLHQWYARLVNAFGVEIGVYYGGEKLIKPITVTTYHSAGDLVAAQGNAFKLLIFDEVHHLPAPSWGETALMSPALYRLGLTATYPEDHEQVDGRWRVADLIGPIVYELRIDDLVGTRLAQYRTERLRIDLTPNEQTLYDQDFAIYSSFFRARNLPRTHGPNWLLELMRLGAIEPEARRAFLARQRIQRLLATCSGKLATLDKLLREYAHEHILIFTEHNIAAYTIAKQHLIPVITHETKAAERKQTLDRFRSGTYPAIVTSRVLNEGVDVPEAKVAIVLGGTASTREYVQRLGRVLRKVGNRQAVLFEVIARGTIEENQARRRVRQQ